MKTLNTTEVLTNFEGEEVVEGGTQITVGLVLTNTLAGHNSNPHRAYQLGRKIATNDEVELLAEDVVYLKESLASSRLGAIIIGQVIDILESK